LGGIYLYRGPLAKLSKCWLLAPATLIVSSEKPQPFPYRATRSSSVSSVGTLITDCKEIRGIPTCRYLDEPDGWIAIASVALYDGSDSLLQRIDSRQCTHLFLHPVARSILHNGDIMCSPLLRQPQDLTPYRRTPRSPCRVRQRHPLHSHVFHHRPCPGCGPSSIIPEMRHKVRQ
jgi:hypothetical protein